VKVVQKAKTKLMGVDWLPSTSINRLLGTGDTQQDSISNCECSHWARTQTKHRYENQTDVYKRAYAVRLVRHNQQPADQPHGAVPPNNFHSIIARFIPAPSGAAPARDQSNQFRMRIAWVGVSYSTSSF
jgi:hypothetical protein